MRINRKKLIITAGGLVLLLAIAGLSNPGRATLGELFTLLRGSAPAASPAPGPDVEGRARSKHGWGNVSTSQVRGTITYFDPSGAVARRAGVTVYQKHPDRLRVDIDEGGGLVVSQGFDHGDVWQVRASSLSDDAERDIRAWLRLWPERLFEVRGGGASYREVGRRVEDSTPGSPGRGPKDLRPAKELDEVEVEDTIGPGKGRKTSDRRMITYLIDRESSIIYSARWMEPDDATQDVSEGSNVATRQVRVDYGSWRRVYGVLWPMEVTHWIGGKVDFRVDVKDVLVNQQLKDDVFNKP